MTLGHKLLRKLPTDTFKAVVSSTPLVSTGLIVRNRVGEVLLGRRLNRPAQGFWFVPGGRVLKDESLVEAFNRITRVELGVELNSTSARFVGPYEHFYPDNFSGDNFTTHYVVLAYEVRLDVSIDQLPLEQHGCYQWFTENDLLNSEAVHFHTKRYFDGE